MTLEHEAKSISSSRCLVVMVPGIAVAEPGSYLSKLVAGLKEFAGARNMDLDENGGETDGSAACCCPVQPKVGASSSS